MSVWWIFTIGTIVALGLVLSLLGFLLYHQRVKLLLIGRAESRYRNLFDSVSDLIYMHDLNGTILEVNQAAVSYFGVTRDHLIGRNIREFIHPRAMHGWEAYRSCLGGQEGVAVGIVPLVVGHRHLELFEYRSHLAREDRITASTLVHGIARNVTDQIMHERMSRKSTQRLRQLLQSSRRMTERLAQLTQALFGAQEEERRRVALELHDEIGQLVAAVSVATEHARHLAEVQVSDDRKRRLDAKLDDIRSLAETVIARVRMVSKELRPPNFTALGLVASIEALVSEYTDRTGIRVELTSDPESDQLPESTKINLFRIVQEALTNVARHAHGVTSVHIELLRQDHDHSFMLRIQDDGQGFDVARVMAAAAGSTSSEHNSGTNGDRIHLGLVGMQERARLIGGAFSISSAEVRNQAAYGGATVPVTSQVGTTIEVVVPVRDAQQHDGS
jgi:PAS domain S-box-containing protein